MGSAGTRLPGAVIILAVVLALAGCGGGAADGGAGPDSPAAEVDGAGMPDTGGGTPGADTGSPGVPVADPALPMQDSHGRTPADAFDEHMQAVATGDPDAVWETYGCSPPTDFDTWALEWEDAAEVYREARVLEERVVADGLAYVRVVYRMTSGDDEVIVDEPGEWWRIEQVEGTWKVGWLPRQ